MNTNKKSNRAKIESLFDDGVAPYSESDLRGDKVDNRPYARIATEINKRMVDADRRLWEFSKSFRKAFPHEN